MSSEWITTCIGEQATLQRGFDITKAEQRPGTVPVVSSAGISSWHDTSMVKGPGVVLGRKGVVGSVHYIKEDFWPHDTSLWVKDFHGNNPQFVYYFFKAKAKDLSALDVGSANPTLNRNHVHPIEVKWPSTLAEQENIASTLGTLDDRITLLRETNTTLEAIAQALFKSWFVDFDPVHAKQQGRAPEGMDAATAALFPDSFEESELGMVPKGWSYQTMSDVSTVGIGKTPPRKEPQWFSEDAKDIRWVSIRDMGDYGTYAFKTSEFLTNDAVEKFNVRRIPENTVLMSFKLTVGRLAISHEELTSNEAIAHFKLDKNPILSTEYIYLALKSFNFSSLSSTSSIADAVNSKTVREIPILVPSREVFESFQNLIFSIFEKIKLCEQQAIELADLRDTLLPRLISGQLRLHEAQALVEDAVDA
jgi:type I restriction enzyme S subunit